MNSARTITKYSVDGHSLEAFKIDAKHSSLPTIVMLHEGLGSISHGRDFPSRLAESTGTDVFVYSRYGHGASDCLQGPRSVSYMHHEAQVVLPEFLRQADIQRPVLIGQSDGGSIAILYAGTFPDSLAGLILEAPHVFVEDISVSSRRNGNNRTEPLSLRSQFAPGNWLDSRNPTLVWYSSGCCNCKSKCLRCTR
jgi:pimeloyl-ACP methyl ester carboxylesterase